MRFRKSKAGGQTVLCVQDVNSDQRLSEAWNSQAVKESSYIGVPKINQLLELSKVKLS